MATSNDLMLLIPSHPKIHAPAPPPGIFENQRSSGGPQALPLIQERSDIDDEGGAAKTQKEEMMDVEEEMEEEMEEEAGEARSAGVIRRPPPPRNGPPPPPRSGGRWHGGIHN